MTKVSIGMLAMQDGPRSKRGAPSRSSRISSGSDGSGQDATSAALAPLGYFDCFPPFSVAATDDIEFCLFVYLLCLLAFVVCCCQSDIKL